MGFEIGLGCLGFRVGLGLVWGWLVWGWFRVGLELVEG